MMRRAALALVSLLFLAACKPDPVALHRAQGDELLRRSDFAGAAAEYAQSLALDPRQEKIWEKLAFCRVKTGEQDAAAEALLRVAELRPAPAQKAEVLRNAAGIFLQGTEHLKAERYLVETVRHDPSDESSVAWLADIAAEKGGAHSDAAPAVPAELDASLRHYARLIELRPESGAAHAKRRVVLVKYLNHLGEERRREARSRDPDAAGRLARIDARFAELKRLLDESDARLVRGRRP